MQPRDQLETDGQYGKLVLDGEEDRDTSEELAETRLWVPAKGSEGDSGKV